MNDGMLSQEEIDALLGGGDSLGDPPKSDTNLEEKDDIQPNVNNNQKSSETITNVEEDALGEIGNIAFGSAATALSTLLNQKVEITTPKVSIVEKGQMGQEFPVPHVSVYVNYTDGFEGSNLLMIKAADAGIIADLMLGGDGTNPSEEITDIHLSAVQEAMNQMMGSSATSMSTIFNKRIDISPPDIQLFDVKQDKGTDVLPSDDWMLMVSFDLKIGNLVDSGIMQLIPVNFAKNLVASLIKQEHEESSSDQSGNKANTFEDAAHTQELASSAGRYEHEEAVAQQASTAEALRDVNIQTAEFTSFDDEPASPEASRNIDLLLDIPLQVTVELGRTKKTIQDILNLTPGSVIELEKLAGEPVDILINQKQIAKGEVVVIDENFGVRITEIINKRERLFNIK